MKRAWSQTYESDFAAQKNTAARQGGRS